METAYEEAKNEREMIAERLHHYTNILNSFPKGPMNLTPDSVRADPEWQSAKAKVDQYMSILRSFNTRFTKQFKKQIAAELSQKSSRTRLTSR